MGEAEAEYDQQPPPPSSADRHTSSTANGEEDFKTTSSEGLYGAVLALLSPIFYPDPHSSLASLSLFHRAKASLGENLPRLREASRTSGLRALRWAGRGSPLRLLLLITVGTIALITLTGMLVFLIFLAAATVNAIILSLFMSLAAAGGFLAMFFAFMAVIYIGALSVAAFVISTATISAIITVFIVSGWIGFFWTLWLATKKSFGLAKRSVTVTGTALSAWHAHRHIRHSHRHHD